MKARIAFVVFAALLSLSTTHLVAGPALSESFEAYKSNNGGALDANMLPGFQAVNIGPNGGPGNGWWGIGPPNLRVVGSELDVTPHSGTNMVRGVNASGYAEEDHDFFNLAYRCGSSNVYSGNFLLDWWFYDPAGSGPNADQFRDYLSVAYYDGIPTNSDYINANSPGNPLQTLSLGGGRLDGGFDRTTYQVQIQGATVGAYDTDGWFNTATARSIGWHRARITVSPVASNGKVGVAFYIDDMVNATLTNSTTSAPGFNCIQLSASMGTMSTYYDDLSFFDHLPAPPVLQIAPMGTNVVLTFPDLWVLQSSTNLASTNFVDVTNAVSPFTNSIVGDQRYFRLRNF
jgi:hypothetical protein